MAIENLGSGVYLVKDFVFVARGGDEPYETDYADDIDPDEDDVPAKAWELSKTQTVYECHAYGNYENEGIYFTGEIVWSSGGIEVSAGAFAVDEMTPADTGACTVVVAVDDD